MPDLKGSKTHQNLQDAFAGESTGNPRYLYFAKVAVAGETHEFTDMYPGIAKTARRVSRKFPTGSRPWQRLRNPVRAAL